MQENLLKIFENITHTEVNLPFVRVIAGIVILLGFLFSRKTVDNYIIRRLYLWTKKTKNSYDDKIIEALIKPFNLLFLVLGFYFSLRIIGFKQLAGNIDIDSILNQGIEVGLAVVVIWAAYRLSDVYSFFLTRRFSQHDDVLQKQFVPLISRSIKAFIIIVGVLLIIQNMGYSVGSLLTGLGIGGLAVALAAQDTLANFFSSLMLLTDMPFRVGDWVKFDAVEGVIESIGFRTTRVRTFEKSLITIPNKIFMNTPIENYTMRDRRRIFINLGITYDTPPEKIEEFILGIKAKLKAHNDIHQDFSLVNLDKFGDFTLNIMVYCFTTTTVWEKFMLIQEDLNLSFLRLAAELKIEFAFPSQTLYWGKGQNAINLEPHK